LWFGDVFVLPIMSRTKKSFDRITLNDLGLLSEAVSNRTNEFWLEISDRNLTTVQDMFNTMEELLISESVIDMRRGWSQ
jgi:hypothetical protein